MKRTKEIKWTTADEIGFIIKKIDGLNSYDAKRFLSMYRGTGLSRKSTPDLDMVHVMAWCTAMSESYQEDE